MKKLLTLFLGLVLCIGLFGQAQSNDAYVTGWVTRAGRALLPTLVSGQYLTNNGTTLSWGAISFVGYLRADGTVPLTANWANPLFGISANNLTATPTLGAEINTGFASWTAAAGWAYTTKWTHTTGTTALNDTQSAVFETTKTYKIVIGYTWAGAGSTITVAAGGQTFTAISSAAASSVTYYLYPSGTTRLQITPTTGFTGSIDSVSIKETTNGEISNGAFAFTGARLILSNGNSWHAAIGFAGAAEGRGIYWEPQTPGGIAERISINAGGSTLRWGQTGLCLFGDNGIKVGMAQDLILWRAAAAVLQLGEDSSSTSINQTIKVHDRYGTDRAGASLTMLAGNGTGDGAGGSFIVGTVPAGAAGTTLNTPVTRMTIDSTGATSLAGDNAQATNIKQSTVILTLTNNPTTTATNLIPAGSMVVGVTCRNISAVQGDATITGYSIGDGSDVDRWGANVAPGINETTDLTDCTITTVPLYAAATSVVLTYVGSGTNFTAGGTVRITVHFMNLTAPAT